MIKKSNNYYLHALIVVILLSLTYCFYSNAEVQPPNYDFSLEKFDDFMPGKTLEDIEKTYLYKELMMTKNGYSIYKFYVSHRRYKFAILVQFYQGKVLDFHARLPQYFLHDIFHQSLINRFKKQDQYFHTEEHAVYVWKNIRGNEITYSGACTITCFPIYFAVRTLDVKTLSDYKPILKKLNSNIEIKP